MSFNQSRSDKSSDYRKSGNRSGNAAASYHRTNSGKSSAGGGGRSFKKPNNVQGEQSRESAQSVTPELNYVAAPPRNVQNGVHQQVSSRGMADASITIESSRTNSSPTAPSSNPAVPKSSQPVSVQTPPKTGGGPPKGFSLQFGSISPGFVNGIQIPPRTSSAPPNLDEQKCDQAQQGFSRTAPAPQLPSIPKQLLPVKEPNVVEHPVVALPNLKKETQMSSPASSSPMKPSALPAGETPMQIPFHQTQGPVQFGVPLPPQFQPQGVPSTSLQMSAILPKGNSPLVQQPIFVSPIQPHPMQHHGIMHQGQGINFTNPLGPQLPHPMSNIGINLGQFTPPQPGKFSSPRRAVKITHPDTREELRLDQRGETKAGEPPKSGFQNTVPPQPQPVLSFISPHPSNYYSSSISSPVYYPPTISAPLGTQIAPILQTASAHYPINLKDASIYVKSPTSTQTQPTLAFGVYTSNEGSKKESMGRSNIINDQQKKPTHKEHHQSQPQGGGKATSTVTTLPLNDGSSRITDGTTTIALSGSTKLVSTSSASFVNHVARDASGSPKLTIPAHTLSEESKRQVQSIQNKAMEQASAELKEGTKEDVRSKENSSLTAKVELGEAQKSSTETMKVGYSTPAAAGWVSSAVCTKKSDTSDESNPPKAVLESKGTASLEEVAAYPIDPKNTHKAGSNDVVPLELNRPKSATAKGKKKIKEVLQKADAAGTTSDLYIAYKGPREKDITLSTVTAESGSCSVDVKQVPADTKEDIDTLAGKNQTHAKSEPDNWEVAEDITSPKMDIADKSKSGSSGSTHDANEMKKYTRDFLMKFKDQCNILPEGFNIPQEVLRVLLASNVSSQKHDRDSYPSLGRGSEPGRTTGAARSERREYLPMNDDKWSKGNASFSSRDQRADLGYGNNMGGFRPGSGGNSGVLRYPHGQVAGQHSVGILSGPLQPLNSFHRENPDGDRWQRPTNSSPQTPAQMMHKAEKKYEVGKVADEEQAKQRQLKGILNKLTPQNFERLFEQVKAVNIDNAVTLTGVISQIFDKALMEPTFCEMYADFCFHLAGELPDFTEGNEKITFKRVLLNKCQEEFERGEREQEEANKVEQEGEVAQSKEEREEKRVQARRRMLGNIRLIGELYKKRMLTERIMHECIKKLLGQYQNTEEEDIEALCKLMSTIGEMIDHPKAKEHMDAYFDMILALSNNMKYSSRVRFMLKDSIDLRKNKWQQRRKVEGPKTIEEVHRDAAHERQAQSSRLTRGPSMNASIRRGTLTDFGPRGSIILASPNSQTGEVRKFPSQVRGFGGTQDVRMEGRQPSNESRNVSVLLPQRVAGNDTVTLGPQGGLARGMSMRGAPLAHITPSTARLNGYGTANDRSAYSSNDNALPRSASGRLVVSANNQPAELDRNLSLENEMRSSGHHTHTDRPTTTVSSMHDQSLSKERLRDMSIAAIKEFYSAKDEKEVVLCIKDLNTPSFYPSMVALWVTDSFERKDMERNLLSTLLVSLAKAQDNSLTCNDLIKGFETVLTALEDAVNDAPRAPEFLGRLFATVVLENVVPLGDIGQIIHKGGEKPGSLVESGLAGDLIGNILEVIQSTHGDSYLNETLSSLRLEYFRPPHPLKSRKLDKFL
ncbi:unnamed protein product [Rhodiola kirilowii]